MSYPQGSPARIPSPNHPISSSPIRLPAESEFDPEIDHKASNSFSQSSYLGSMWTGLIRRFSAEDTFPLSQDDTQPDASTDIPSKHTLVMKDGIHGVFNPDGRTASPFRPPPLDPIVLRGYKSGTSGLLTNTVAEEIRTMIPERLRLMEKWTLLYSLEQDGASLATLYQKCKVYEGQRVGFVLVVKDQEGGTFGAYLSDSPHPAPSYFGNGECFLWRASTLASLPPPPSADTTNINITRNTTVANSHNTDSSGSSLIPEMVRFKAFPYSGLNDFYLHCETGFLSVGSGGGYYGLWLDDGLNVGHSSRCETFGNEPLSDEGEKFGVLGVELWVIGG